MQHRANRNVHGRHRRTTALHSHRAPSTPATLAVTTAVTAAVQDKGRYAVAAALVAGVGVVGVTTATGGASSSPAAAQTRQAATQAPLAPSPAPTVSPALPAASPPSPAALPSSPAGALSSPGGALSSSGGVLSPLSSGVAAQAHAPGAAAKAAAARAGAAAPAPFFVPQGRKAKPLPQWVNPMPEGTTTSCFGQRWGRLHAGVDLAAPSGTRIGTAGAGVVVAAGPAEGYGNAVLVDHGNGYLTHYGHMSTITVTVGQHLAVGDQIGTEGSTGHSTGPHLHFEVHEGFYKNPIEPTAWMHDHGVDIGGCPATPPAAVAPS